MKHKFEELVVIPKSELFRFQPPMSGEVKHLQLLAKPLLSLINDAFDAGVEYGVNPYKDIRYSIQVVNKSQYLAKDVEL